MQSVRPRWNAGRTDGRSHGRRDAGAGGKSSDVYEIKTLRPSRRKTNKTCPSLHLNDNTITSRQRMTRRSVMGSLRRGLFYAALCLGTSPYCAAQLLQGTINGN